MKIFECKRDGVYDIGFVDPYIINEIMIQNHAKDSEENLLRFMKKLNTRTEILFPYNFK